MNKLLTYAETKALFGWKGTTSVRRYVRSGDLVRVHVGKGMNTYRVTEESAHAFLERIKRQLDEQSYLERAAAHTAKMRRAACRAPRGSHAGCSRNSCTGTSARARVST